MFMQWLLLLFTLTNVQVYINALPMQLQVVDMTHPFDNTTLKPPHHQEFELIVKHNGTKDGKFWLQLENIITGIHVGTHMDAPCHIIKGGNCLDELPIENMIAPAAVVDVIQQAEKNSDYLVQTEDLQKWEVQTGHSLNGKIVLIKTGWGRRWSNKEAFTGTADEDESKLHSPGMSAEASRWLVNNRKVYGLGTEALSLDYGPTTDNIAHQILLGANLFGLECIANMEKIPIHGATLIVAPIKITHASGAPVRIMATFPKHLLPSKDLHIV